jgi:hypothetical protein
MIPQEYVKARSVLLDALGALGQHRDAVILVGAQAVYAHTDDADFATAPTTTDADLALVPGRLADEPAVVDAMLGAGFEPGSQPGSWVGSGGITVDLMAPEALCVPGGRRSAQLQPPHDDKATARRTLELEPAVVDNEVHVIAALDRGDARSFEIKVAGTAALVVSKVVKIAERREQPQRLKPKDGLDVLRLLRAVDTTRLARSLVDLAINELSSTVVVEAMKDLRTLATTPDDLLPVLAADAEAGFGDPDEIKMSMVLLVSELLRKYDA